MSDLSKIHEQLKALEAQHAALLQHHAGLQRQHSGLQQQHTDLQQKCATLTQELKAAIEKAAEFETLFKDLFEKVFGRRSERFEDPDQLQMEFPTTPEQLADAIDGVKQAEFEHEQEILVPEHRRQKQRASRQEFPAHLPRIDRVIDLSDEEKVGLKYLGEDVTETLDYVRPELRVIRTHYPKYIDPAAEDRGVMQADREPGLIAGNRLGTSIAAEVITNKYGYHLPVYRQEDWFASGGWTPSRSSLLNLMEAGAHTIRPLIEYFIECLLKDGVIGTDDTRVCLVLPDTIPKVNSLDPKSGRAHEVIAEALEGKRKSINAHMWAYRGTSVPLNVFDFTVSRHRDGPDLFLVDREYRGVIVGDCYGANTGIAMRSNGAIAHAACAAHARRKVHDALDNHSAHARYLLSLFQELYELNDQQRGMEPSARLADRQSRSREVWERMRAYLDCGMTDLLPKDKLKGAAQYIRNQWEALTYYLNDPLVPIDNNDTEQLMKQVAVGRKNWQFIGSIAAGYRAADLMTLVSSAIRNDLDVASYVRGVLDALLSGERDYAQLRPDHWIKQHPEQSRSYRQEERKERNARRDRKRRQRRLENR